MTGQIARVGYAGAPAHRLPQRLAHGPLTVIALAVVAFLAGAMLPQTLTGMTPPGYTSRPAGVGRPVQRFLRTFECIPDRVPRSL